MANTAITPSPSFRKAVNKLFLISFMLSLGIGIYMILLSDFQTGIELQIFTTGLGGMGFSATLLVSSLLVPDRSLKILGYLGVICSVAGLALWLYATWLTNEFILSEHAEGMAKTSLVLVVLSAYFGYISLLLYFRSSRIFMIACQVLFILAASIIALFLLSWILQISPFVLSWRVLIALGLLIIAGLVLVPVLGRMTRN
ncbi:MAG TPA: hypothetical protein PK803_00310 [Alphaproteobacteria bacterium]|nr:hypothetical protein [Alphaproteobacteria bacterium]